MTGERLSRLFKRSSELSVAALAIAVILLTANAFSPGIGRASSAAATFPDGTVVAQGGSLIVSLSGFTPGQTGTFGFQGKGSGTFIPNLNGSASISFAVSDPPGVYVFYAQQGDNHVTEYVTVTGVGQPSTSPQVVSIPPTTILMESSQAAGIASLVLALVAGGSGLAFIWDSRPDLRRLVVAGLLITVAVLAAHLYVVNVPESANCTSTANGVTTYGCIGDEQYYVPAAQHLLAGDTCSQSLANYPPLGSPTYCNLEHTPLVKLMMAEGMSIFGQTALGWRLPVILASTFSIPLLMAVAYMLSRRELFAYFATLLLAFDTLYFVQSSAGLLDAPVIFFALAAAAVYLWGKSAWFVNRNLAAGVLMGLSVLSKESGVFLLLALLTYHLLMHEGGWRKSLVGGAELVGAAAVVTLLGMQVFYSAYAPGAFGNVFSYLSYMSGYAELLRGTTCLGQIPYYWLISLHPGCYDTWIIVNYVPAKAFPDFIYWTITNPVTTLAVIVWVPLAALGVLKAGAAGFRNMAGESRAVMFSLVFFSWGYLPYIIFWLLGRTTYPYYMMTAVPAMALGSSFLLTWKVNRWVAIVFVAAAFLAFLGYFPYKGFMPDWLRALFGER